MGLGVFMNAGISHASTDKVWTFSAPFLLINLGCGVVTVWSAPIAALHRPYHGQLPLHLTS